MTRWDRFVDVMWWAWWHFGRLFDPLFWPERHRTDLRSTEGDRCLTAT